MENEKRRKRKMEKRTRQKEKIINLKHEKVIVLLEMFFLFTKMMKNEKMQNLKIVKPTRKQQTGPNQNQNQTKPKLARTSPKMEKTKSLVGYELFGFFVK